MDEGCEKRSERVDKARRIGLLARAMARKHQKEDVASKALKAKKTLKRRTGLRAGSTRVIALDCLKISQADLATATAERKKVVEWLGSACHGEKRLTMLHRDFDRDGDCKLSRREFAEGLTQLGCKASPPVIQVTHAPRTNALVGHSHASGDHARYGQPRTRDVATHV